MGTQGSRAEANAASEQLACATLVAGGGDFKSGTAQVGAQARSKDQLLPDANAGPEGWASRDKSAAVLETAAMNDAGLGEYCRKRGLFAEQIKA